MGCLTVTISNKTVRSVCVDASPCNRVPQVSVVPDIVDFNVESDSRNVLVIVNAENRNSGTSVHVGNRNISVRVSVGLVCQVGMGNYRVFYVEEGPFMVKEGYFYVLQN